MKETDPYRILKMEFPGLRDVIQEYASNGTIANYLNILEKSLACDDIPQVMYALEEICAWYNYNIGAMRKNEWVFNMAEHIKEKTLMENLLNALREYDFSNIKPKAKDSAVKGNKVFIVHGHDNEAKIVLARTLEQLV